MKIGKHKSESLGRFDLRKALKKGEETSHVNIIEECSRSSSPCKGLKTRTGWYVGDWCCWNGVSERHEARGDNQKMTHGPAS